MGAAGGRAGRLASAWASGTAVDGLQHLREDLMVHLGNLRRVILAWPLESDSMRAFVKLRSGNISKCGTAFQVMLGVNNAAWLAIFTLVRLLRVRIPPSRVHGCLHQAHEEQTLTAEQGTS
ncbi:hypothetical protein PCANC_13386 [Puccinia coronata f. sp. avenae]|uniref:Uncharacterized protein n=1 Tax=Puccinia coronata f. sp. avenae TaxID=200324 RepID=A0A2N5VTP4_9BASI|nr:hypothetical protein PCANC_13386 [Puccinia coronata f. sp. avenae]